MARLKAVSIYTDGACSGNPGPGGCAAILTHGIHRKELTRGYRWTTNNRMELMALILGLENLKYRCLVVVYTDSKYLLNAFEEKWLDRWKATGWRTKARTDVLNIDLWKQLDHLLSLHHLKFNWVKGHSGHPENTRCDKLAVEAAKGQPLMVDQVFEILNPHPEKGAETNNHIKGNGEPPSDPPVNSL